MNLGHRHELHIYMRPCSNGLKHIIYPGHLCEKSHEPVKFNISFGKQHLVWNL